SIPKQAIRPKPAEVRGGCARTHLRSPSERRVFDRNAFAVAMNNPSRCKHVVVIAHAAIVPGTLRVTPIRTAETCLMAAAAGHRVVERQLLVPEQDFAQYPLGFGDRIFFGYRNWRQIR